MHRLSLVALLLSSLATAGAQRITQDPFLSGVKVPAGAIAVVNADRIAVADFVEAVYGRFASHYKGIEALNDLLQNRIVEKNGRERNMMPTPAEVQAEFERLDAEYRKETKGQSIDQMLKERQLEKGAFLARLKTQLALQRMTAADFDRDDTGAADQMQWLRSKMIEAEIERDAAKLPENAAARVYGGFITKEFFAKRILSLLAPEDVTSLVQALMESKLAGQLCARRGIEVTPSDLDATYQDNKRYFEQTPKFQGLKFEDFLRERTGMSAEAYMLSAGFYREACRSLLGRSLVRDDDAPGIYKEFLSSYGPIYSLRHILVRGSDHAAHQGEQRTMPEAEKQARSISDRLLKGENFEELVKVFSEDPTSKFRKGKFGEFTPASLAQYPEIAAAVTDMKVGDFRGPFRSTRGFHIVKLQEKRPAPPLSEKIVRDLRKRVAVEFLKKEWLAATRGVDLRRFLESD